MLVWHEDLGRRRRRTVLWAVDVRSCQENHAAWFQLLMHPFEESKGLPKMLYDLDCYNNVLGCVRDVRMLPECAFYRQLKVLARPIYHGPGRVDAPSLPFASSCRIQKIAGCATDLEKLSFLVMPCC